MGRATKYTLYHGDEVLEGQGVVIGVEAGLVPVVAEAHRALIGRVVAILLPRMRVLAEKVPVVIPLEEFVVANHPGVERVDEGLEDGCGDLGVVSRGQVVANVVKQCANYHLLIGTIA